MIRLAFFDMDGTLCAPRFYVNGVMVPGMSDDDWLSYCKKNGADTYRFCKVVTPVADYASELRAHGAELYDAVRNNRMHDPAGRESLLSHFFF